MTQYAILTDLNRCVGCQACSAACKTINGVMPGDFWIKTLRIGPYPTAEGSGHFPDVYTYFLTVQCQHCADPECVKVCPTTAMHKDASTGLVSVDEHKCIGCGYCHMACPYNAPKVDREKGHSVKCNGCAERVAEGKNPICVDACPLRALGFGPIEDIRKKYDGVDSVPPLPDASYTHPNIVVKKCPAAARAKNVAGLVANPLEVM